MFNELEKEILICGGIERDCFIDHDFSLKTPAVKFSHNDGSFSIDAPTLAELRYAYFGRRKNDLFVSEEFRTYFRNSLPFLLWTSSFVYRGKLIESPRSIYFDNRKQVWIVEGGRITDIKLPPEGWIIEYDKTLGLPTKTSHDKEYAERVFGDDASTFNPKELEKFPNEFYPIQIDPPFNIKIFGCGIRYLESFPEATGFKCRRTGSPDRVAKYSIVNGVEMERFQRRRAELNEDGKDFT